MASAAAGFPSCPVIVVEPSASLTSPLPQINGKRGSFCWKELTPAYVVFVFRCFPDLDRFYVT